MASRRGSGLWGAVRALFRVRVILLVVLLGGLGVVALRALPPQKPAQLPVANYDGTLTEQDGRVLTMPPEEGEISLFLAGDSLITLPWSDVREAEFLRMIGEIRAADVSIANLETVIHEYRGYAQAEAGGTWMASPPRIADELIWAGFDIMSHANNHTFDYGSIGVLETHENASRAGLTLAGSGPDLQAARAPRYVQHAKGTVGLVSTASTFTPYGRASWSRPDLHGRPGLNPLTIVSDKEIRITRATAERLQGLAQSLGYLGTRFVNTKFNLWGIPLHVGDRHGLEWGPRLKEEDREGNLAAVEEAARKADIVVVSVHAHWQGEWLRDFAHQAIDAGADVFFAHGPHETRAIEIYKGKPIFYCLGDFVFQAAHIERLPAEYYEGLGLGDDVGLAEARRVQTADETIGFAARRAAWEGVGAALRFKDDRLIEIRLLPLDLQFGAPAPQRGRPQAATDKLARRIIETIAADSEPYGTEIVYVEARDFGVVRLDPMSPGE